VLTYTISGNVAGGVGEFDIILGAKVHAFADAVDVIANVTLIRLRIQELICTLEYSLLMRKPCTALSSQKAAESIFTEVRQVY